MPARPSPVPANAGGLGQDRVMKPLAGSPVRIARPSHDLRAAERFWVGGLGLDVLFRADDSAEGGHALLMVGWPGAAWHLELVGDPENATPAAPSEEDLLVLYLGGEVDEDLVRRLVDAGGTRVSARNPYWPGRPPAVTGNRGRVPAPVPPDSTRKSENSGGRKRG